MTLEHTAVLAPCLVVFLIPGWSVWRMVRGLRTGGWRRPGWLGHATFASFFVLLVVWLYGLASGAGLQSLAEKCTVRHNQPYDDAYYEAHRADYFRLFPLSSKCNAHYDLIPAWVNPAVAVFFVLFVVSAAGLIWTITQRSTVKGQKP